MTSARRNELGPDMPSSLSSRGLAIKVFWEKRGLSMIESGAISATAYAVQVQNSVS